MTQTNSQIVISKMCEDDVAGVAQLERACFTEPWSENAFRDSLLNPDIVYIVAKDGTKIVGNAGLRHIVGEGEITNVAVDSSYRNRGIACEIMKELLKEGEKMGAESFTLEVRAGNVSAISLYQKLGFKTEGSRKNFYEKPTEDGLIMWLRPKQF